MKKIIIYGAGNKGIQLYKWLINLELEYLVYAFCDRNYKSITLPWNNIKIMPYESLKDGDYIYLISLEKNEDIKRMLKSDDKEFYVDLQDFIKRYSISNKKINYFFSTKEFHLNETNLILENYFHKTNYKIVEKDLSKKFCYIFFSSNGLYYPNDIGTFCKTIEAEDKFEWENLIETNILPEAAKSIYVRDLRKTWYVTGINYKINSIDKLIILLKEITKGYEIITVGGSAGGYMASIVGAKMNAYLAFNFSGQFSLYLNNSLIPNYYWLNKFKDDKKRNTYYNICEDIKDTIPIVYFYPKYCKQDVMQAALVKDFKNVYTIPVEAYNHGETISNKEKVIILTKTFSEIKRMYK